MEDIINTIKKDNNEDNKEDNIYEENKIIMKIFNNDNNKNNKKAIKGVLLGLVIILVSTALCGCSLDEAKYLVNDITGKNIFDSKYFDDIELEVANDVNGKEIGAIKAKTALDLCKEEYASTFTKKYFSEDEENYLYQMQSQHLYLANNQIIVLEETEYYEILLFELNKEGEKNILAKYYVNSITKELFDEASKPEETKVYLDNALGIKIFVGKKYESNIKLSYSEPQIIKIGKKDVETRIITFTYVEEDYSNELFNIIVFSGVYPKEDFGISDDSNEAYYLGANDKYTFCLKKSIVTDNYLDNASKILNEDFNYILKNIKIY